MVLGLPLGVKTLDVDGEYHRVDAGASILPVSVISVAGMLEPTRLPSTSEGAMDSGRLVRPSGEPVDAVIWTVSTMLYAHPTLVSH